MRTVELNFGEPQKYFVDEAYKSLRANIQFCGTDVKAIAITSCEPGEGKSTTTMEIARSLAEAGKKVLLIDADMRRSVIVKNYVESAGICGLSQYLSGQNTLDEVLFATQVEGFHIIFAGQFPANPVELLGSKAFGKLIEEQTKVYDYVLVDTPPLGLVIDCAVVANVCDSAIIIVATDRISYRHANAIKNQLAKSGVHILGVVLNKVHHGQMKFFKPYYRSSYAGPYSRETEYAKEQEKKVISKDE